ncbi:hypothetical protein GGR54DRAFT_150780 [Hypoxylon sp. NC1633]|nr:hypothetical protein GGR54DRAFT_150780 [Hypoxylon sp. NC1633]
MDGWMDRRWAGTLASGFVALVYRLSGAHLHTYLPDLTYLISGTESNSWFHSGPHGFWKGLVTYVGVWLRECWAACLCVGRGAPLHPVFHLGRGTYASYYTSVMHYWGSPTRWVRTYMQSKCVNFHDHAIE